MRLVLVCVGTQTHTALWFSFAMDTDVRGQYYDETLLLNHLAASHQHTHSFPLSASVIFIPFSHPFAISNGLF